MRAYAVAMVLVGMAVAAAAAAQLPAQKGVPGKGERPTAPPQGKMIDPEPTRVPGLELTPKAGGQPKATVAIADAAYMIGIQGYPGADGVVVMSTVQRRDLNQRGRVRCPAAEIAVDFQGNGRLVLVRLEPGDKITAVGGYQTRSLPELVVAVNSAANPHALEISFIDWRTGNEYTGTVNAMRVK